MQGCKQDIDGQVIIRVATSLHIRRSVPTCSRFQSGKEILVLTACHTEAQRSKPQRRHKCSYTASSAFFSAFSSKQIVSAVALDMAVASTAGRTARHNVTRSDDVTLLM